MSENEEGIALKTYKEVFVETIEYTKENLTLEERGWANFYFLGALQVILSSAESKDGMVSAKEIVEAYKDGVESQINSRPVVK